MRRRGRRDKAPTPRSWLDILTAQLAVTSIYSNIEGTPFFDIHPNGAPTFDVEFIHVDAEPGDPVHWDFWAAMGRWRGDSAGVLFGWSEYLVHIIVEVQTDVDKLRSRYPQLQVVCTINGDAAAMRDAAQRTGSTVPA